MLLRVNFLIPISLILLNLLISNFNSTFANSHNVKQEVFVEHENLQLATEIDFLLNQIKKSNCIFIRNYLEYTKQEAIEHILNKYEYFKEEIHDIKDFIKMAATKSLLTGIQYRVLCNSPAESQADKQETYSNIWLMQQLKLLAK